MAQSCEWRGGRLAALSPDEFRRENSASANGVFLLSVTSAGIAPAPGWRLIGCGTAPWPGHSNGFAVLLEKVSPPGSPGLAGGDLPEGARIWHHLERELVVALGGGADRSTRTLTPEAHSVARSHAEYDEYAI